MKSKIWTIAQREYFQRIKTRSFILITLLGPLALVALVAIPVAVEVFFDEDDSKTIAIIDETEVLQSALDLPNGVHAAELEVSIPHDTLRARVETGVYDGFLLLPAGLLQGEGAPQFFSKGGGGFAFRFDLERSIGNAVRAERIRAAGATDEMMELLKERPSLHMVRLTEEGAETDATAFMSGVGYFMGFLIYICMFLYGTLVMRGVIEEKTNRILEVVASSARPFELMMGKVLGIGALGMTQFIVWIGLSMGLLTVVGAFMAGQVDPAQIAAAEAATQGAELGASGFGIPSIPVSVFVYFLLFFLGGYLLYASLFAAVGSAVEQESDAQQFFLPISLPIILAIIFMMRILSRPDGVFSIVASIFPLFSPILMPARAAVTPVPFWQVALALVLLVLAFLGTVWLSSRIYRVGILMYGKKPTFKDLIKWVRYA